MTKTTDAPKGCEGCPRSLYRVLITDSPRKTTEPKMWELSSCKMANYRSVLPCAAANYIEELLPTIPKM